MFGHRDQYGFGLTTITGLLVGDSRVLASWNYKSAFSENYFKSRDERGLSPTTKQTTLI